eukprot:gene26616-biopygen17002
MPGSAKCSDNEPTDRLLYVWNQPRCKRRRLRVRVPGGLMCAYILRVVRSLGNGG